MRDLRWIAIASRLDPVERRRRFWHMAPGLLPVVLWLLPAAYLRFLVSLLPTGMVHEAQRAFPNYEPLALVRSLLMAIAVVAIAWMALWRGSSIARCGECSLRASVLGYAGSVLLMVLFFPAHLELAMTVLAVIAFGDGTATFGGIVLGGPKLPWNCRKTWTGTLSFLICAAPFATLYYGIESGVGARYEIAIACGVATTVVGAIVESIPSRLNDNIRVGMSAAATVTALRYLLAGW